MTSSTNAWLSKFFAEDNKWELEKIQESGYPAELQSLLATMLGPVWKKKLPFALPRLDVNSKLLFYLVAEDKRQLTELATIMLAYLGSVRTKFVPEVLTSAEDSSEEILLAKFQQGFLKISIPEELNKEKVEVYLVFKTINSVLKRYSERPPGLAITRRPIGRILSDFFIACDRRNGNVANKLLEELRASGEMSPRNLYSIELQTLAANSKWKEVLNHPRHTDMLSGRIPGGVEDVLFDALQNTYISSNDPNEHQLETLLGQLEPFRMLFQRTPFLASRANTDHWKIWAIGAAAFGYSRVLEDIPEEIVGQAWIDELTKWATLQPKTKKPASHFQAAITAEPKIASAVTLLKLALESNQREGLQIYRRLSQYSDEVLREVKTHNALRNVWTSLRDDFEAQENIDSWSACLASLIRDDVQKLSPQSVSEACCHWDKEKWDEKKLTNQLLDLSEGDHSLAFRDVIPILRKWLQDKQISPSSSFTEQLLLILALDDIYSVQDLILTADLISDLTVVAHTKEQYVDAINAAIEIWNRTKSVNSLEEGLEIMDVLLDSVCADSQAQLNYWTTLQEFCLTEWRRLKDEQRLMVLQISEDLTGSSDQFPSEWRTEKPIEDEIINLEKKKLAIYTLTEGAGRRASATLGELFPGLKIHLNHDTSATKVLVNLADTADYFIFASQSAAHQAFDPVSRRRNDILYPAGKGSSSIVRCFLDAIQT